MKLNKNLLLFNFIISNICCFEILFSSSFVYENNTIAPLLILIFGITITVFLLIYPNIYHKLLSIFSNHITIKLVLGLYLLILIGYSFGLITFILQNWFYHKTPYLVILIFLLIPLYIISKNYHFIFYYGFIFGIIVILFNLIPIFNSIPRNFDFIKEFKFDINYKNFILIFSLLDPLLILVYSSYLNEKLTKKSIIFSYLIIIIFSSLMLLENYLFLLPDVFINIMNPSFLKYQIYFVNYLIDNIDIILIINIIYFSFTKLAIYLNLFKDLLNRYNYKTLSIFLNIIVFLISMFFYSLIFKDKKILNRLSLLLTILLSIVFILPIFFKKEDCNEILSRSEKKLF